EVEQHQVGTPLAHERERLFAVHRHAHGIAPLPQLGFASPPEKAVVLGEQDVFGHYTGAGATGSTTRNSVPCPSSDSHATAPPNRSRTGRTRYRRRPFPSVSPVGAFSAL